MWSCLTGDVLIEERKVLAAANPHVPHGFKLLDEAERAVVHCAARDEAVVGVEVA